MEHNYLKSMSLPASPHPIMFPTQAQASVLPQAPIALQTLHFEIQTGTDRTPDIALYTPDRHRSHFRHRISNFRQALIALQTSHFELQTGTDRTSDIALYTSDRHRSHFRHRT